MKNIADLIHENNGLRNKVDELEKEKTRLKYLSLRNAVGYIRDITRLSDSLKKEMAR